MIAPLEFTMILLSFINREPLFAFRLNCPLGRELSTKLTLESVINRVLNDGDMTLFVPIIVVVDPIYRFLIIRADP